MEEEKALIQRAQDGDTHAFEILVQEYQTRIFSIAYRMMQNQEDAADLTQEILLKLFKNRLILYPVKAYLAQLQQETSLYLFKARKSH